MAEWVVGGGRGLGHLLGFNSSGRCRLPEVLWERTEQELQKLVSILIDVSIKGDNKPEAFLCAFPTTIG